MIDFGAESIGKSEAMGQQRHKILQKVAFFSSYINKVL